MPLIDKIQDKTAVIGVVGLGYVGLPLAIAFAEAGFSVIPVRINWTPSTRECLISRTWTAVGWRQ